MRSGGQIPWNAITLCKMPKTSWQTGKLFMNEALGNHLKDQLFHLVHWGGISPKSERDKARIHQFGKKVLPGIFLGYALIAEGIWKGDTLTAWKLGCIRNLSQKTECKRSLVNPQRRIICISRGRWFSNIISKRLRIPRTHVETGTHRKEREP